MTRALVLLSGGLDSTTALSEAIRLHGVHPGDALQDNSKVSAISVNYGQRHLKEIESAKKVCDYYGVNHEIISLGAQPRSMLTDASVEVPNISYAEITGVSPTYVPFRNGQMLSAIAAWAHHASKKFSENFVIYFGAHAEDAANWAYPDCTPEFIGAMANAIFIGTYQAVRLVAPFQHMTKAQIVEMAAKNHAPLHLSWSCYKGEELHCGVCPTCRSRKDAFALADCIDPTQYAE